VDLLLDTNVFLWWESSSPRLRAEPKALIADPANQVFVSAAAVWEIAIKRRLGKLAFAGSAAAAIGANGFAELPILAADAEAAGALDWGHADPFDRLIVAQAERRGLTLMTADAAIRSYAKVSLIGAS
jgi:PIN domain nuclease of toxin-antitoxin system